MPSHLHPRSRATSTLFAGTLVASFVVVAVPHIWPCPRPRQTFMEGEIVFDEQGRAMRRVRRKKQVEDVPVMESSSGSKTLAEEGELLRSLQVEAEAMKGRAECPVPKPSSLGKWFGISTDR